MKKHITITIAALLTFTGITLLGHDGNMSSDTSITTSQHTDNLKPQTICPVMGSKINKNLYVDYNGKRIYVCCKSCINIVKKSPEKYIKILQSENVEIADSPEKDKSIKQ